MTDPETRLNLALRADGLESRDPMFRLEILERRERAAFHRQLLAAGAKAFAAAILAALGLGAIDELLGGGAAWLAAVTAVGVVVTAVLAAPYAATASTLRSLLERWRTKGLSILQKGENLPLWY